MNSDRYYGLDALQVVSSFGVVFLHVYVSAGSPSALEWFVKLRDFALPVMVMSSFFVLTTSLARKSENGFYVFFKRGLNRFWVPLIAWSLIYTLFAGFAVPFFLAWERLANCPRQSFCLQATGIEENKISLCLIEISPRFYFDWAFNRRAGDARRAPAFVFRGGSRFFPGNGDDD